jgi:hypothetical protein
VGVLDPTLGDALQGYNDVLAAYEICGEQVYSCDGETVSLGLTGFNSFMGLSSGTINENTLYWYRRG